MPASSHYLFDMMPTDLDQPATKRDLLKLESDLRSEMSQMRSELRGEMSQMKSELRDEMAQMKDQLTETMRDMQTEVLRAFHGWARPVELRIRNLPQIEERLVLLEERVAAIERGPRSN